MLVQRGRQGRVAVFDPERGTAFTDLGDDLGSTVEIVLPDAQPLGSVRFDLQVGVGSAPVETNVVEIWDETCGLYLTSVHWAAEHAPQLTLPAGRYRARVSVELTDQWRGGRMTRGPMPRSDLDEFELDQEGYFSISPEPAEVVFELHSGAHKVVPVTLSARALVRVSLAPRSAAAVQPRVRLSVRRRSHEPWTSLQFLRDFWGHAGVDRSWIRAGSSRTAIGLLANGRWLLRARCEDGSQAFAEVALQAGQITTVQLTLDD